jgi:hypothetical protein
VRWGYGGSSSLLVLVLLELQAQRQHIAEVRNGAGEVTRCLRQVTILLLMHVVPYSVSFVQLRVMYMSVYQGSTLQCRCGREKIQK